MVADAMHPVVEGWVQYFEGSETVVFDSWEDQVLHVYIVDGSIDFSDEGVVELVGDARIEALGKGSFRLTYIN